MISLKINRQDNVQMRQLWDNSDADQKDGIEGSEKMKRSSWTGTILGLLFVVAMIVVLILFS
jgi:hypothetical protein